MHAKVKSINPYADSIIYHYSCRALCAYHPDAILTRKALFASIANNAEPTFWNLLGRSNVGDNMRQATIFYRLALGEIFSQYGDYGLTAETRPLHYYHRLFTH
jgi:hypothetical protein